MFINIYSVSTKQCVFFSCDICSTEVPSRYTLKMHKQTQHGVSPGPDPPLTPATPNKSSNAGITTPAQQMIVTQESAATTSTTTTLACPICQASLESGVTLAIHLRTAHASAISEQLIAAYERLGDVKPSTQTPPATDIVKKEENVLEKATPLTVQRNGAKLYRCSYCTYYTRWLSNLSVHERRHTGGEVNVLRTVELNGILQPPLKRTSHSCAICACARIDTRIRSNATANCTRIRSEE